MSDEELPDLPAPDWMANTDELKAGLRDLAEMLGGYRDNLLANGFDRPEAQELVNSFQVTLVATTRTDEDLPD